MITACRDCACWEQLTFHPDTGVCRRHAPVIDPHRKNYFADRFPYTRDTDYCFEALSIKDHAGAIRRINYVTLNEVEL